MDLELQILIHGHASTPETPVAPAAVAPAPVAPLAPVVLADGGVGSDVGAGPERGGRGRSFRVRIYTWPRHRIRAPILRISASCRRNHGRSRGLEGLGGVGAGRKTHEVLPKYEVAAPPPAYLQE